MPWKKDLAKLKQVLGKEETAPAKASPPKPKPAEGASRSMEEEDNVFLAAMGMRPRPARPNAPPAAQTLPATLTRQPAPSAGASAGEFGTAMEDLKGVKRIRTERIPEPAVPAPVPAPAPPAPEATRPAEPPQPAPAPAPEPAPQPAAAKEPAPRRSEIHLAAGMAIPVDGGLDLKGHALSDAEERLKERILDGYALGWRTLHVTVGPSPELRQMVLDLLDSPAGSCVSRFAQAPIPMGGVQAWILYFRERNAPEN